MLKLLTLINRTAEPCFGYRLEVQNQQLGKAGSYQAILRFLISATAASTKVGDPRAQPELDMLVAQLHQEMGYLNFDTSLPSLPPAALMSHPSQVQMHYQMGQAMLVPTARPVEYPSEPFPPPSVDPPASTSGLDTLAAVVGSQYHGHTFGSTNLGPINVPPPVRSTAPLGFVPYRAPSHFARPFEVPTALDSFPPPTHDPYGTLPPMDSPLIASEVSCSNPFLLSL